MSYKAYIFDLDSTLIKNNAFEHVIRSIVRKAGLNVDPEKFYELFSSTYYELVRSRRLKEAFDWDLVAELTFKKIDKEYPRGLFSKLMLEGIERGFVKAVDHAIEVLKGIRKTGKKIIVLTNGYRKYQKRVVEKSGIYPYIHALITNDDVLEPKPSKKAFETALAISNIMDPSKVIFVGDHPFYDIYGALNSNIGAIVWLTRVYPAGNYAVMDLAEYIINYARDKYDIVLDLHNFRNRKIRVINSLKEMFELIKS